MRHDPLFDLTSQPVLLGPYAIDRSTLTTRAGQAVATLLEAGLSSGDTVAVSTSDDALTLEVLLAGLHLGVRVFVLDPQTGPVAARQALALAEVSAIVLDPANSARWALQEGRQWVHRPAEKSSFMGRLLGRAPAADPNTWRGALSAHSPVPLDWTSDADTPALILRTSGTSGVAHLPVLSQGNLDAQARAAVEGLSLDTTCRFLVPSPASHIDGIWSLYLAWRSGVPVYRPGLVTIKTLGTTLDGIYKHRITHAMLVPSLLRMARRLGLDLRAAFDTPDFRVLLSTAEPLPEAMWRELEEELGVIVGNVYGMTEVGNVLFAGPAPETLERGTVGFAVRCSTRIVDGELQLSGPTICQGYLGEPPLGEWFATGDLAHQRDSGAIELTGRKSNLLKVGGHRVVPEHVDAVLQSHPAVVEAMCFGLPDPTFGHRLAAAITTSEPVDVDALRRWTAEHLADVEVPREIRVTDALPRGATGKTDRRALQAWWTGQDAHRRQGVDVEADVLAIAAQVFRADPQTLSLGSSSKTLPGWDSVAHLDFAAALEKHFGITLTATQVATLDSLNDAVALVG